MRKNRPCAHRVFGVPFTINSVNLGFVIALQKLINVLPTEAANIYTQSMIENWSGTGIEMWTMNKKFCPTQSEFIKYSLPKNLGFYHLQVRLVQACGKNEQDFLQLSKMACIFYQVANDYSDIVVNDYGEGKNFCEDITEGKFTFPTIHAIKMKGSKEALGDKATD